MCAAPGARTGSTAALQAGRKQERGGEARGAGGAGAEGLPGRAGKGAGVPGAPGASGRGRGAALRVRLCAGAAPPPFPGGAARWAGAGVFTVTWTRRWQLGRCQVIGAEEPPPQPGRKMQDGPAGP